MDSADMPAAERPTTLELIQLAQRGDALAVDELMRRHLAVLRAFVRAKTGPELRQREADSDLVQTVCREALRSLQDYQWRGEGSFRLWLFSVALHKLRNKHHFYHAERRDLRRERGDAAENHELAAAYGHVTTPSQHAIARELVERVEAALDRLEPAHRDVIVLSRIVGLSHKEIGAHLGKSAGAVRATLNRALARLAGSMQAVECERRVSDVRPPPAGA